MFRNKSVPIKNFGLIPRANVPRSMFSRAMTHKTTLDAGWLVPIFVDEVLPGDSFNLNATLFARMSTPIFPLMDNLHLDSFWFFVPNRLVWNNWVKFMGEQDNPGDSISYVMPKQTTPAGGYAVNSLQHYMGLPTVGVLAAGATITHSALFLRAYNLIWNQFFRDENLQNSAVVDKGDGPDTITNYTLLKRGKRHDYITSCLPWPQKGGTSVTLPLGTSAPVYGTGKSLGLVQAGAAMGASMVSTGMFGYTSHYNTNTGTAGAQTGPATAGQSIGVVTSGVSGLYADLSTATAATINQLRQSFAIQELLERDARGGTRYTELIKSHFGVINPDFRLQRAEYLGGASTPISINSIAQTSATVSGQTPLATLSAMGTAIGRRSGFNQSFTEHGMIIGLVSVRADLSYQQGLRKMWSRDNRYDFYTPEFANLGEQAVLNKELYVRGNGAAGDDLVWGYQERWAEYRHLPSLITGLFASTAAGTIDGWHLAQNFTALPTLNSTFIQETPPMDRILAVGAAAGGKQFLFDAFIECKTVRPIPMNSIPGLGRTL